MTRADVARELGVSVTRVLQLDDELKPRRSECGVRLYDRAAGERLARGGR
jgi:hypothetical protein